MKRILLIEDERNFAQFMELELQHEGFDVSVSMDGVSGLHLALSHPWDLILLDLMLPGMNGIEVCKEIRKAKKTPIIMITARDSITDRVSGLDSGADDYIPKPFAIEELLARIRVVFRRQDGLADNHDSVLACGELKLDPASRIVTRGNEPIELTKREFALLEAFMKNPNRVLSRETLLDTVWGYDAIVDKNVVDVYVRYLRNKIDRPEQPSRIESIRGIGYVMR
ncbi:response regulator transcription factor [Paenibacillus sp. GCM10027627]|uniref:response regulator transcription factor n=1 Tax=unclassified Paenibacillus TaxID=185978 RepID=UPI003625F385